MILLQAYVRRKRFEAKLLAVEIGKVLGGASRQGAGSNGRMHSDDVLKTMGLTF